MFLPQHAKTLTRLGFKFGKGGAHAARTMMFSELQRVMEVTGAQATKDAYRREILDENVLNKRTARGRSLSYRHLRELYELDPAICLFRVFQALWCQDVGAHSVLALQLALARDALLRLSAPFVLETPVGQIVSRDQVEALLASEDKSRFSPASLKSFAQNILSTWTQAGFLKGRRQKVRTNPPISPGNVAYALFMARLDGFEGPRLFSSDCVRVLDQGRERLIELTQAAAQRGLLVFRRTGDVMEVRFPGYLTAEEAGWLSEEA